jgi:abnormal spindle-like microcephaly-associated protein
MKYPILSENISDPSMYEEKWLEHQEIAITQLANGILESARGRPEVQDGDALRRELLEQYQGAYFSLLYKRVYASILHGALRVPQDILRRGNRLKDDIGFQRRFLNFWTGTYDLLALRAAAETVVGRRISCHEHLSTRSPDCTKGRCKSLRPAVQAFLETFLLRNEDSDESAGKKSADDDCTAVSGYQKTILRCIMMIVLLDKARTSPDTTVANRLFLPSAEHKSSTAVLQELGRMLLPSTDIIRSLNHLDCQVSYQQFPMQEYEYKIQNLAVDLRDGVIIARLAELLFFVPNQLESGIPSSVILPTGEALHLVDDNSTGPLSKHLKVPCRSRAAKLFNVQVTLSALADFGGMSAIVKEISAADIVDGYREKTIALLWGLVGKRGLSALIDWVDVKGEIRRLERKYMLKTSQQPDEMGHTVNDSGHGAHDGNGQGESQDLLTQWAARLASLKGLRLENLTTSFSDGRIFESIVDEYEFLIKSVSTADEKPTDRPMNLESRLRSLGCSAQFGKFSAIPVEKKKNIH